MSDRLVQSSMTACPAMGGPEYRLELVLSVEYLEFLGYWDDPRQCVSHAIHFRIGGVADEVAPGDIVLALNPRPSKLHGHLGPFKVLAVRDHHAISISPLLGGEEKVIHADQAIRVEATEPNGQLAALQAGDAEEYYVEAILGVDEADPSHLIVKWLGYDESSSEGPDNESVMAAVPTREWLQRTREGRMYQQRYL
ncbi:hypothetical protein J8273_5594 [Carpediemonas membranifera]|uniref:Chromo domain-containing protein n=1 Tax=Carpediemonas membranifera TaxID=201153 RepID=A0A8J6B4S8_9EUKA|nr:hypothetical protein J8273_5594 [Carpediemonas membranifera]|eukprot:KAG9392999.1 hypothetical protein J8273_5594 [Carpediemonas membranifera]